MIKHLIAAFSLTLAASCVDDTADDSMYLDGSEEHALQTEDGEYVCDSPRKVLICHIPPGNPENAHTICVGEPAVAAHQRNHGDPVGPCDNGEPDDGGDPDDGDGGEPDAGGEPDDGGDPDDGGEPDAGDDGYPDDGSNPTVDVE